MERFKNFTVGELNAAALAAGFAPLLKVQSMCVLSLQLVLREVLLLIFYTIKVTPYPAGQLGNHRSATITGGT
jgi:hypothetical protein